MNEERVPTVQAVIEAVARIREDEERQQELRQVGELFLATTQDETNAATWARIGEAANSRQRWVLRQFAGQAREARRQMDDAKRAGHLTEAEEFRKTYCARVNAQTRILDEIRECVEAGQSAAHVAETIVPPGCVERIAFRDAEGRIKHTFERRSDAHD